MYDYVIIQTDHYIRVTNSTTLAVLLYYTNAFATIYTECSYFDFSAKIHQ